MISPPAGANIWIAAGVTDLRRGFTGLSAIAQTVLEQNPFSGHVFVFRGKRGDLIKLLWWDEDGLAIWYKRLEEGTLVFPTADEQRVQVGAHGLVIRPAELAMLLDGIDLNGIKRRKRYQRPKPKVDS